MTIFYNSSNGVSAIPYNRILEIIQNDDTIKISYDSKEYTWLDEEKFVPKTNSQNIKFDSVDLANEQMRSFYKACEQRKGAFFFG